MSNRRELLLSKIVEPSPFLFFLKTPPSFFFIFLLIGQITGTPDRTKAGLSVFVFVFQRATSLAHTKNKHSPNDAEPAGARAAHFPSLDFFL